MRVRSMTLPAVALAVAASAFSCQAQGDPQLWLDDFAELERQMSVGYANLEFSHEAGRVDLVELHRETLARLQATSSMGRARKAIEAFIAAFDDPHLRVERRRERPVGAGGSASGSTWQLDPDLSTGAALDALGYDRRDLGFRLTVEDLDGYEAVGSGDTNPFDAGVLPIGGRRFGFLRIAHFGEDGYPTVAAELWEGFRGTLEGPCDAACWWAFNRRVSERLLADLGARARQLVDRGIDALVVDVTGNGGGTDWAGAAPFVLTRSPLDCNPAAFVRHEHWSGQLERDARRIRGDLDAEDLPGPVRELLEEALGRNGELLAQTRTPCDWSAVWEQPGFTPDCSPLVRPRGCVATRGVSPSQLRGLRSASLLDGSLRFEFERGVYAGPLIVVMDGGSASATEQFVSLLQANGAATVVGSRSTGAGCGYTAGGISVYLENTKLLVRLPDCVRYTGQGLNELSGLEPDVPIDWKKGAGGSSTRKLVEALATLDLGSGG